ncbi:MAG: AraC family transcriptional regulator [Clostridiales bacterium]|jgi:YesN/AraC family two-component response regulator|nr:AraC family transcriptional regulator [Clostridiales bacterium]
MNILIVDDESVAIQGIIDGVIWGRLPVERVLTAGGFAPAADIIRTEPVDIMLCDIEMPGRNGLDLIEWTNAHRPDIVTIILSCHDEFHFAQQAVRLGCMEYALKPIDPCVLTELILKAIQRKQDGNSNERYQAFGKAYFRSLADGDDGQRETPVSLAEGVKSYITAHISENLTVAGLAEAFHFSPDYFSRLFKRETGQSVIDCITEIRISLAAGLVRDTSVPLALIPEKLGLDSYSYFVKRFRRRYGVSPKEYRSKNN